MGHDVARAERSGNAVSGTRHVATQEACTPRCDGVEEELMANAHSADPQRVARVSSALAARADDSHQSLCVSSADLAQVDGAGVVLILHGGQKFTRDPER
jgi:hypothetical protein